MDQDFVIELQILRDAAVIITAGMGASRYLDEIINASSAALEVAFPASDAVLTVVWRDCKRTVEPTDYPDVTTGAAVPN
ncbi:hypothetical protein DDK22_00435 [Cupriavidus necator]|uniref:Uncharacterized protein n=1 Tax=Cupriavidus necator TaxID=106590 RepID=A0A367PU97_CUPNE|nr:hypothetical protein DDK22_00435 [Cupriavidus necator]